MPTPWIFDGEPEFRGYTKRQKMELGAELLSHIEMPPGGWTQQEIALVLGVRKQRVQRIIADAINKLQRCNQRRRRV